jgi:hypothetical protein
MFSDAAAYERFAEEVVSWVSRRQLHRHLDRSHNYEQAWYRLKT